MQKRLCGREQEFGIKISPIPKRYLGGSFEEWRNSIVKKILLRIPEITPAISCKSEYNFWLGNGSRIYEDMLSIEVAGAEHEIGSFDGIAQEKASELILNKAAKLIVGLHGLDSINFYKNNTGPDDEEGTGFVREISYGSHHNYSYLARKRQRVIRLMKNFIPAMLPISGSGHVLEKNSGFIYVFSPRANHIVKDVGEDTTGERAVVDLRGDSDDDPLMDRESGLNRLHVISRDATRCEFQTWLVDMITHLVLRLAEEDWHLPYRFSLRHPTSELHRLNAGIDLKYKMKLERGQLSPIDYNFLFLRAAKQLKPLSQAEKKCLEEWERILRILKAGAFNKLVGELDWATKLYLIKNQAKKGSSGFIDAWQIDMEYHNISNNPRVSWFARLDDKGYIKHLVDKEQIKRAVTNPPETRAKSRGRFIRKFLKNPHSSRNLIRLDWEMAETNEEIVYFGTRENPFSTKSIIEPITQKESFQRRIQRSFPH